MPRPQRPWFRFYVEMPRDKKIRRLSPAHRWLWTCVLSAARESPVPGVLMVTEVIAMNADDLADYAGMKVKDVQAGIEAMIRLGIVDFDRDERVWSVPAFLSRQFESDDVTARTRKHRSKEHGRNVPTSTLGTPPETETESETDLETPQPPPSGGADASHPPRLSPRARGDNPRAIAAAMDAAAEPTRVADLARSFGINRCAQGVHDSPEAAMEEFRSKYRGNPDLAEAAMAAWSTAHEAMSA